jgi:hypothetical protein
VNVAEHDQILSNAYICTKNHGSVAVVVLMFLYLPGSLASKDGKTDIGDTPVKKSIPAW